MILMNQNYSEMELTLLLQISGMDVVFLPVAPHSGHSSLIWGDGEKEKKIHHYYIPRKKNCTSDTNSHENFLERVHPGRQCSKRPGFQGLNA